MKQALQTVPAQTSAMERVSSSNGAFEAEESSDLDWLQRTIRQPESLTEDEQTSLARVLLNMTALIMRGEEEQAVEQLGLYLQTEGFTVFLCEPTDEEAQPLVFYRKYRDGQEGKPLGHDLPMSLYKACMLKNEVFRSDDSQTDDRLPVGYGTKNQTGSLIITPMLFQGEPKGVIVVGRREAKGFHAKQEKDLQRISNRLGEDLHLRRLQIEANVEKLTGGLNRHAFLIHLKHEINRAERFHMPLCLVLAEVNEVEKINQQWGREAGDALLCHMANQLFRLMRGLDICARIDDDVFAVLLPGVDLEQAERAVRRWMNEMHETPFLFKGQPIEFMFSAGVAALAQDEPDGLKMLAKAQMALEKIKERQELNICVVDNKQSTPGALE